ncbi:methyl-accepting chemotaxis protein [Aquibium microcysteis]|uniref:methyl-accepting chemotaxis protein n=1 Tax=Aquibium microcysteis TaxID=675281 RepID=UPI00165D2324|nr:methyl-accepting chemotaxis protein [Aquibium microcysteis]
MNALTSHFPERTGAGRGHVAVAETLAFSRRSIEKSFLDMGQRLLESSRLLREITAAHEGMPGELQGEQFSAAVTLLTRLREEAVQIASRQDANGERVDKLAAMARELEDPIDGLSKAVRNLGLIAINARIIAAGMAQMTGDFDSFALEMVELGKNAASIVEKFSKAHRRLIDSLAHAGAANAAFRRKHEGTLSAISVRLGDQLAAIDGHKAHALADVAQSGRMAGSISRRIGEAVSAMQIGDITRQRLEHVEDSLTDLDGCDPTPATEALVLRVQALQLAETQDDFGREVAAITKALLSLSADAQQVLDDSCAQSEALLSTGGTALAGLVADLGSVSEVLADYEAMRTRIEALRAEVGLCVADMQARMEDIGDLEQSMRLLSINTSVRCSRFGEEGRALRVVAQEMRELAAFTVEAAATITGGLTRSKSELGSNAEPEAGATTEALSGDASRAIELLEGVVERMRVRATTIADVGPRASRLLRDAAAASETYGRHAQGWQDLVSQLDEAGQTNGEGGGAVDPDLLDRMRSRYTMVAERRIHDDLCGEALASGDEGLRGQEADASV